MTEIASTLSAGSHVIPRDWTWCGIAIPSLAKFNRKEKCQIFGVKTNSLIVPLPWSSGGLKILQDGAFSLCQFFTGIWGEVN